MRRTAAECSLREVSSTPLSLGFQALPATEPAAGPPLDTCAETDPDRLLLAAPPEEEGTCEIEDAEAGAVFCTARLAEELTGE